MRIDFHAYGRKLEELKRTMTEKKPATKKQASLPTMMIGVK